MAIFQKSYADDLYLSQSNKQFCYLYNFRGTIVIYQSMFASKFNELEHVVPYIKFVASDLFYRIIEIQLPFEQNCIYKTMCSFIPQAGLFGQTIISLKMKQDDPRDPYHIVEVILKKSIIRSPLVDLPKQDIIFQKMAQYQLQDYKNSIYQKNFPLNKLANIDDRPFTEFYIVKNCLQQNLLKSIFAKYGVDRILTIKKAQSILTKEEFLFVRVNKGYLNLFKQVRLFIQRNETIGDQYVAFTAFSEGIVFKNQKDCQDMFEEAQKQGFAVKKFRNCLIFRKIKEAAVCYYEWKNEFLEPKVLVR